MIKNRKQYYSTKKKIKDLENALKTANSNKVKMSQSIYQAMIAGIQSQIDDMKAELQEYDQLADANSIPLESLESIGKLLIKARISHKYSQKDLAEKLGFSQQQIQKYEADEFQSADLKRIVKVAKALELSLQGTGLIKSGR